MNSRPMSSGMPQHQMAQAPAPYIPSRDSMDRHDYGISKNRKASSTGGGRAWSDEEVSRRCLALPHHITNTKFRSHILSKLASRRCHISTLQPTSRRQSWLAVFTTISSLMAATDATSVLPQSHRVPPTTSPTLTT